MTIHQPEASTPTAAVALMVTVLAWGAAWGVQLMMASATIPNVETEPSGYWLIYSVLAAAFALSSYCIYQTLKTRIHLLFLRRTRHATLSSSERAEQYLLRREIRERNRPVGGFGGPVPQRWKDYLGTRGDLTASD